MKETVTSVCVSLFVDLHGTCTVYRAVQPFSDTKRPSQFTIHKSQVTDSWVPVGETTHYGGGALEYMTLPNKVAEKEGEYYFSAPGSSKYGDAAFGEQFDFDGRQEYRSFIAGQTGVPFVHYIGKYCRYKAKQHLSQPANQPS
eukprot:scaffold7864_cov122-Skeletonema_dohrnii-CCMP3373.AAC.7